ncbi:hypothetical protein MLD38_032711 [Melastoma candidum]|uniref:Uncharacterized protein n=1 Tax=Melastoma candidum TaxID=119954 RepID=A0ACB9M471_9MYRT|nr:hypothetical protein MLD38_032711 [Melastoma candidum]
MEVEVEDDFLQAEGNRPMVSPEIVEIEDDCRSVAAATSSSSDVYVAVGKDDLDVLKWAIDHCVHPGSRVFLIHVFPPITYINTPVGRLSRSQLNQEQVRVYINEENNRRRNTLQKYIRLCADAKLDADTLLIEHKSVTKAILALIPVLNITKLVIGVKRLPYPSRLITKKPAKGELLRQNAPKSCEVVAVYHGQKNAELQKHPGPSRSSAKGWSDHTERKFFESGCFAAFRPNARSPGNYMAANGENNRK